jgi:hypothetical protein
MTEPRRLPGAATLGAFGLGLVLILGGAAAAGKLLGPVTPAGAGSPAHSASGHAADPHAGHGAGSVPGGLQVAQDGYRLQPVTTTLPTGTPAPFAFRVLGTDGTPVTRYTVNHECDLHLIVVRRDLSGFQHVHPTLSADGTWRIDLAVPAPGQYRVLADFQPTGHPEALTLGVDLPSAGLYEPVALPAPGRTATVDGYTVDLAGDLVGGKVGALTAKISRDGREITDLQPYLGALGHLVVLRDGDLAYLHVHPGDGLRFHVEVPSAGAYRLYLEFQHAGVVHRAEFTLAAT